MFLTAIGQPPDAAARNAAEETLRTTASSGPCFLAQSVEEVRPHALGELGICGRTSSRPSKWRRIHCAVRGQRVLGVELQIVADRKPGHDGAQEREPGRNSDGMYETSVESAGS